MARRPRRRLTALLIVAVLGGCAGTGVDEPSTTTLAAATTTTSTTTTTTAPATTTTIPPSTTATTSSATSTSPPDAVDADVSVPEGDGPFPAVVLVHGGGWVTGGPRLIEPLADYLNGNGFMTVNTRYALATLDRAAFPDAVDDVACAVRYAAGHPDSDGTVSVIGHSAGAHIGAIVALTGQDYVADCPLAGSGVPDRFVGLAGPYDVSRLGLAVAAFFGGGPENLPDAWDAGNPQLLTDENPNLEALIMYGELDGIVSDTFAIDFHEALRGAGAESLLELVEGARHNDMHDPDLVGELIVTWLKRQSP